jgi:hypothetical protein
VTANRGVHHIHGGKKGFDAVVWQGEALPAGAHAASVRFRYRSRDGEEVVQVYLKKNGETDGPIKTLRAFKRVRIPAGKTVKVELELTPKQLEWWDNTTNTMRTMQNTFDVLVGGSSQEKDLQKKTLKLL